MPAQSLVGLEMGLGEQEDPLPRVGLRGVLPWPGLLPWGWTGVFAKSYPLTSFEILVGASLAVGGVTVTDTEAFVSLESF